MTVSSEQQNEEDIMRIHVVARNIDVLTSEAKYPCGRQKRQRGSVGSCEGIYQSPNEVKRYSQGGDSGCSNGRLVDYWSIDQIIK